MRELRVLWIFLWVFEGAGVLDVLIMFVGNCHACLIPEDGKKRNGCGG